MKKRLSSIMDTTSKKVGIIVLSLILIGTVTTGIFAGIKVQTQTADYPPAKVAPAEDKVLDAEDTVVAGNEQSTVPEWLEDNEEISTPEDPGYKLGIDETALTDEDNVTANSDESSPSIIIAEPENGTDNENTETYGDLGVASIKSDPINDNVYTEPPMGNASDYQDGQLTMAADQGSYPVNSESIQITTTNNSSLAYSEGAGYGIERYNGTLWEKLPLAFEVPTYAKINGVGAPSSWTINLYQEQYDYTPGRYRVVKEVYMYVEGGLTVSLAAEFVLE